MMTNGDPEGHIFLSYPYTNNGFFFLFTTVFFYLKISFQKSLNTTDTISFDDVILTKQ